MNKIIQNWFQRYFSDPQVISLIFLLSFGMLVILMFGHMLMPVIVSMIIAYLLDGFVTRLQALRIPRIAAVVVVSLLFIALIAALFVGLLPLITGQLAQFLQELPAMIAKGQQELLRLPEKYPQFISQGHVNGVFAFIDANISELGQYILTVSLHSVRGIIELLVYVLLVPFLVFFFLKDKEIIFQWMSSFLPEERGLTKRVWYEANQQFANYIRGKIWEIVLVWSTTYITFFFIGLEYSMILSLFVGLAVLIPYIGATVMVIPVALIAFFQWGPDLHLAYVLIAYAIIHAVDGNILAPLLQSEVVDIHPVAIIVAILVFGGLWGFWGLVFAIPLATLLHSVHKAWTSSISRPIPVTLPATYEAAAGSPASDAGVQAE
jgi:putative permease